LGFQLKNKMDDDDNETRMMPVLKCFFLNMDINSKKTTSEQEQAEAEVGTRTNSGQE
jgi:hypothetical protein